MAVCLHCLHEARVAARERRQRVIVRFSLWAIGIGVVGAVSAAAVGNVVRHTAPPTPTRSLPRRVATTPLKRDTVLQVAAATPVMQQGSADTAHVIVHDTVVASPTAQPAAPTPPSKDSTIMKPRLAALNLVLPVGRTDLRDSVFATRSGDTVVVHFDTSPARTRRADKFDHIVRETLHAVYGPVADTLLATVPEGRLAAPNELVTGLPARGVHLSLVDGRKIGLWPETRPGRDGPLVVAYRTMIER